MNKPLVWLGVAVVVILVIIGVRSSSNSNEVGAPIKIGVIGPMSGDAGMYGPQIQNAANYALKQINDAAGENGQKYEIIYEDGKCAGNEAVSAFTKLTDINGLKLVIGGFCSSETLAIAPIANEKKVVTISNGSSNPKIENEGPYTFSLSYSDSIVGEQLAKAVAGAKRVAIITEQNDYNVGIHDVFVDILKQFPSVTLVSDETFPKGGSDFRALLTKVRAANPDAIVLNPNVGVTAENLLKQMAEMKTWTGYKLYSQIAYLSDEVRNKAGAISEGMIIIDAPTITDPAFTVALAAIEKDYGTTKDLGNYYVASTMDAVKLATMLISQYGNDPVKMQEALSTGSFKGFIGDIKFGGNNFVQFEKSGTYLVTAGKAVLQ